MARKYRNLIGSIVDPDNLRRAYRRTALGRRLTYGALEFKEHAEVNLARLGEEMADGRFEPDPVRHFTVFEPKRREITALSFRDRVAHHALVAVIGPIFEASLLPRTFACRPGLGTHAGVRAVQAALRRLGPDAWFLKTDFSRFFASIDRSRLWLMIEAKISCGRTLDFIARSVPRGGRGLPIGALTSQIFANVYAGAVDRLLAQQMKEKMWFRYMDDIVVLGRDRAHLGIVKAEIEHLAATDLGLSFSKWSIAPAVRGVNFLGCRIWASHKLLRRQSVIDAKRKIRRFREAGDIPGLTAFVGSWRGHAGHADCHNLLTSLGLELTP